MAGRFPGAKNLEQFWENLKNGVESISFFSDQELEAAGVSPGVIRDPRYIKAKGALEDTDAFDADFFSYPPREAERMDPQIRLLHECAWEAVEQAGYNPEAFPGRIGAYFGANENLEWLQRVRALGDHPGEDFDHFLLNYRDYVATRISYKLNLKGPSFTLLSACSTSLVSIHLACRALLNGECEMALAGGVSLSYPQKSGYFYQEGLMLSSDGHCRTFDARADGTVFGDGIGVVLLKPLEAALQSRDCIRAVIKGSAVNNDGNGKIGFTAPSIDGQKKVISAAIHAAGIRPSSIVYIETHGTGTRLGDPIEIEALRQAFRVKKRNFCALGSVKSNIGHVNVAAGVSSFIKTVLALENRQIPPSLHFKNPNPRIDLKNSPFYVNTALAEWKRRGTPRRAGVSAFGFGGTNAHLVLEEAPSPESSADSRPVQLIVVSAKTQSALRTAGKNLAGHFRQHPGICLADAAYTLSMGRRHFSHRRAVVAKDIQEAAERLDTPDLSPQNKKAASAVFMFPGQGSQYVGTGEELYRSEPVFREHFDLCANIIHGLTGLDIRDVLYPRKMSPEEAARTLTQTAVAQPAIFTISYSLAKLLMAWGVKPEALIGHSLGEFVAACLAGVFSLEDGLRLVVERGRLMQQLPPGSMLAVPLSEQDIQSYLGDRLSLSAVNGPSLCVVSGDTDAVEEFKALLQQKRIASQPLATSHAFHSHLMDPILEQFARLGEQVPRNVPSIPIMSTVTGDWASPAEITDLAYWAKNLRRTVRFSSAIQKILKDTNGILLEVGPGRTLSHLAKMHMDRAAGRSVLTTMRSPQERHSDEAHLLAALGNLWTAGLAIDWENFYGGERRARVPLPTYPFERKRYRAALDGGHRGKAVSWATLIKKAEVAEWFAVPSWKRMVPPALELDGAQGKLGWLVLTDKHGLGSRMIDRLGTCGQDVTVVHPGVEFARNGPAEYTLNPAERGDYERLFQSLNENGRLPHHILHLWTVTPPGRKSVGREEAESLQNLGFLSLLFLAQAFGTQNITDEVRITVVSNHIHDVTGTDAVIAEKATVMGPVKVIPQEYPNINGCCIDIIHPGKRIGAEQRLIDQILIEAVTNMSEPVVAYRGDYRWVQTFERVRLEPSPRNKTWLREGGVYLITGGLGGIGLALAEYLGKTARAKLILTARTALPPKDEWDAWLSTHDAGDSMSRKIRKIRDIEAVGGEVLAVAADVTDAEAMKAEISRARKRFGTIHGVIHAAGVPGEGIIQLKKADAAMSILAPKVMGTLILEDILKGTKLDFLVLCSSIASILGGIGLSDYSAANAFLDSYAARPGRGKNYRVISINWDMWGEVGMGLKTKMPSELQAWLEKELRDGITTREGIDVLERVLSWGKSRNVIVSTRDLQARIDLWIKREFIKEKESLMEEETARPTFERPETGTEYASPQTEVEAKVAASWERLFGIERVGRHDNFYELGGHSLLATTLVNRLKREFETNLSIRDILDHPTVSELSAFIQVSCRSGNQTEGRRRNPG